MLVITSIKEDLQRVSKIFEMAKIPVFSVSDTIGHKSEHDDYLLNNWFFGGTSQSTEALFFFSFTDDEKASATLELVKEANIESGSKFPVRAFVVPVEASSH